MMDKRVGMVDSVAGTVLSAGIAVASGVACC